MRKLYGSIFMAFAFAVTIPAVGQDSIATLMVSKQLSTVPLSVQSKVFPGGILVVNAEGSSEFYPPKGLGIQMALDLVKAPLKTATIAEFDSTLETTRGLTAKFLGWAPGIKYTSSASLISNDQIILSVAQLDPDQVDTLVYTEPSTLTTYKQWDPTPQTTLYTVYLVQGVYYANELSLTSSSAKGLTAATGGDLPACDAPKSKKGQADSTQDQSANKNSAQDPASSTDKGKSSPKANTVADQAEAAGKDAAAAALKDAASDLAGSAAKAAGSAIVTVSGQNCVDSNGTAHLKSVTPIPIGLQLDKIGYFGKNSTKFDWDMAIPIALK